MFNGYTFTKLLLLFAVLGMALLLGVAPVEAAVIEVPCVEDASQALSAAIGAANDTAGYDIISLAAGCTYLLPDPAWSDESYGLLGLPPITEALTIEGNGASVVRGENDGFRFILTDLYVPLAINDLTFANGYAYSNDGAGNGGAVYARGPLTLDNVHFRENYAQGSGGAVFMYDREAQLLISNSVFEENVAEGIGGAVFTWADLTVNNSHFITNTAGTRGGAIANGTPWRYLRTNIQNSRFEGNVVQGWGDGGALSIERNLTLSSSEFVANWGERAGAVHFIHGYAAIAGTTFDRNEARGRAAGIVAINATLSLQQSTFTGNAGGWPGATVYLEPLAGSHSRVVNNLFVRESSEDDAATLYIAGVDGRTSNVDIMHNTIVEGQLAAKIAIEVADADQVVVANNIVYDYDTGLTVTGSNVRAGYNTYYAIHSGTYQSGPINPFEGSGYSRHDPSFVDAAGGDYRLHHGSWSIDSAYDAGVNVDIAGEFRPKGSRPDRGAYENESNGAPIAIADAYETMESTNLTVAAPGVLANDSDPEGDALYARLRSSPEHAGYFTLNADGSFTYSPVGGYSGQGSFTYNVDDEYEFNSDTVTVTITVHPNLPPTAVDDAYEMAENTTLAVPAPGLGANDSDPEGDSFQVYVETAPMHASEFTLSYDGSFSYVPESGYTGEDTFTYYLNDAYDNNSNVATVTITIGATSNTPPTAVDDNYDIVQDTTLTVIAPGLLGNDSDADGDALMVIPQTGPAHGSLTIVDGSDGSFTYTPNAGYTGQDSFTYAAHDGVDQSNVATVTITVGAASTPSTADFTYTVSGLTVNFTDQTPDADTTIATWQWDFGDGHTATVQNAAHTYASAGTYNVTLTVTDFSGITDSASKEVTVSAASDFTLTATGYKVKGLQKVDLAWSGATSTSVHVFQDGALIATTDNDGFYTHHLDRRGGGSYTFQVCEAGTATCSNEVTVTY
jgi:PKD repeat protein